MEFGTILMIDTFLAKSYWLYAGTSTDTWGSFWWF